jgi:hypothetical protein
LGCSTKGNAKKAFLKCGFIEGKEYVVRKYANTLEKRVIQMDNSLEKRVLQSANDDNPGQTTILNLDNVVRHTGGSATEKIWMSTMAFDEFAVTVNRPIRKYFVRLKHGVLKLKQSLEAGIVELSFRSDKPEVDEKWLLERRDSRDSVKNLMTTIKNTGITTGAIYAQVNGATNETILGLSKAKMAKHMGVSKNKVKPRNQMKKPQLGLLTAIEGATQKLIEEGNIAPDEILALHKSMCDSVAGFAKNLRCAENLQLADDKKSNGEPKRKRQKVLTDVTNKCE